MDYVIIFRIEDTSVYVTGISISWRTIERKCNSLDGRKKFLKRIERQ